jgi:hypothetical protein
MGIMRWAFYGGPKEKHPNAGAAYGCAAKNTRIRNGLEKDHAVDARCIGGNPKSIPLDAIYTAFHIKLSFLELDYTASAKCRDRHFAPLNG